MNDEALKNGERNRGRAAMQWGSAGAGAVLMYEMINLLSQRPELFFGLVSSWGTQVPLLVLFGLVSWKGIAVMREHAAAQQAMAGAVERSNVTQSDVSQSLRNLAGSIGEIAARESGELISIKASVGSLHGKFDSLLERLGGNP